MPWVGLQYVIVVFPDHTHSTIQSQTHQADMSTVKPVLSGHSKRPKNYFLDRFLLNAGQKYCRMLQGEHSAIPSTFIKLPFVKTFVLTFMSGRLRQVLLYIHSMD